MLAAKQNWNETCSGMHKSSKDKVQCNYILKYFLNILCESTDQTPLQPIRPWVKLREMTEGWKQCVSHVSMAALSSSCWSTGEPSFLSLFILSEVLAAHLQLFTATLATPTHPTEDTALRYRAIIPSQSRVAHLGNYLRIISTSWNCCSLTHHILILEYDRLSLKEWSWLLTKPSMSVTRPGRTGSSKELSCRMGREQRAAITSSTKLWKTLRKLWENFAHKTSYSIPISFINAKVPPNINKALKVLAWVRTLVSELLRREISYEIPEEFWHLLDVSFNFCNKNLKLLMLLHARPSSVLTAPIDMYALHLLTKINYWEFYPRQPQAAENLSFFFQRWRCTGSCSLPEWTTSYGIGHDHMNFQ